ncbi:hypothetical protein V0288_04225 [Pannus brasiliensis CCIBt3594]|uniref:Uncharacterized protein n=1 Tax=Pannus brasiliensis CCIBt3594 TaxID=1427578 RepID=A0AAW9QQ19_9CHRO
MKKIRIKVFSLSAGLLLFGSNFFAFLTPALAEWIWDSEYLKWRFETFIRDEVKKNCDDYSLKNLEFKYQTAIIPDDKTIAYYGVVLGSTLTCWENLQRAMETGIEEGKLSLGAKKPKKVAFFPDVIHGKNGVADGGPTIMFYFPATKSEICEMSRSWGMDKPNCVRR